MEDKISILKEIAETGDAIKKIKKVIENVDFESFDGIKGEPGKTPEKGKDYFTPEEVKQFKEEITPVKGKDYFDGKDADEAKIIKEVVKKIPKPKDGKNGADGYNPIKGKDYFDGKDGKDAKIADLSAEEIVKKLHSLKEGKRLSYKNLDDTPEVFKTGGKMAGTGYLREITDVAITDPQGSDGLVYDATTKKWKNSGSVNTDEKVKASATDPTAGYLDGKVDKSVVVSGNKIQLSGDAATPGNSKYYGTDGTGAKGFYTLPNPDLSAYETLKKVLASKGSAYPVVLGDTGKILVDTAGITFTLPVIASGDVGTKITIVKNNSATTTIAPNSGQSIDDTSVSIYSDINEKATITLLAISTTQWVIISSSGTWSEI